MQDAAMSRPSTAVLLDRVFVVIGAFRPEDRRLSLRALVERTGLPRSSVHRIAQHLVKWGVLERDGASFRIGMKLFEFGELASPYHELRDFAIPFLQEAHQVSRETVDLAILSGVDIVYLAKITADRSRSRHSRVGGRLPAYCTAIGRVLLASDTGDAVERTISAGMTARTPYTITSPDILRMELADIRRNGHAIGREEMTIGTMSVAAPVRKGKRVIAAISLTAPMNEELIERLARTVTDAATQLSYAIFPGREGTNWLRAAANGR